MRRFFTADRVQDPAEDGVLFGWYDTWSRCFVEGCFTYDLAVQIVGTLGALGIALVVFWVSRRTEEADTKEDRAEQWRLFNAQAELTRQQIASAVESMNQDREQWNAERRSRALEREWRETVGHLTVLNALFMELERFHALNANGMWSISGVDLNRIDGLTREYMLLPLHAEDLGYVIDAHRTVQLLSLEKKRGGTYSGLSVTLVHAMRALNSLANRLEIRKAQLEELIAQDIRREIPQLLPVRDDVIWSKSPNLDSLQEEEYAAVVRPDVPKRPPGLVTERAAAEGDEVPPEE